MKTVATYWALTKPGITRLVTLTAAAGFWLGARGNVDLALLAQTLVGTGLVVGGTNALNQWWERDADARACTAPAGGRCRRGACAPERRSPSPL